MPPPRLGKYVEMAYTVTINLSVWIIPQLWRPLHYGIGIHSNQSSMRDLMPITRLLSRAAGLAVGLNSLHTSSQTHMRREQLQSIKQETKTATP